MLYCPQCGRPVPEVAVYCHRCGASLAAARARRDAEPLDSLPSGCRSSRDGGLTASQTFNSLVALDRSSRRRLDPAASGLLLGGRYRILRTLGRGGLGVVYRAWDEPAGRFVACKILLPHLMNNPDIAQRFRDQVLPMQRLEHPSIVPVLDAGKEEDVAYLVMPLMSGGTLRAWIRARKPRRRTREDLVQAAGWTRQIADGLAYAHRIMIHRDLKPENLLLDGRGRLKISDFDLAKFRRPSPLTMTGEAFGTAYYMAPEQIRNPGAVDARADLFSLGVVLYETVTGVLPVGAFRPPSKLVRGCPEALDRLVMGLMAFRPQDRFPNAETAARETARVLSLLAGGNERAPEDARPRKSTTLLKRLGDNLLDGYRP